MAEQRFDASVEPRATKRLERLGIRRIEPAWIKLWALALAAPEQSPAAWLLGAEELRRPLLLPGATLPTVSQPSSDELWIDGVSGDALYLDAATPPSQAELARHWLWERLAKPRLWRLDVAKAAPTPLWFPCFLGYATSKTRRGPHHYRVVVASGLSGELLPQLKPLVLKRLLALSHAQHHQSAAIAEHG